MCLLVALLYALACGACASQYCSGGMRLSELAVCLSSASSLCCLSACTGRRAHSDGDRVRDAHVRRAPAPARRGNDFTSFSQSMSQSPIRFLAHPCGFAVFSCFQSQFLQISISMRRCPRRTCASSSLKSWCVCLAALCRAPAHAVSLLRSACLLVLATCCLRVYSPQTLVWAPSGHSGADGAEGPAHWRQRAHRPQPRPGTRSIACFAGTC